MVSSGVGQYSINVKSNLRDFYGELSRSKRTMDELVGKKYQLEIDSKQLNELRDKAQRINGEMRELRQQKTEIKLGMEPFKNAEKDIKAVDKQLSDLNNKKVKISADTEEGKKEIKNIESAIEKLEQKKIKLNLDSESFQQGKEDLSNLDKKIATLNRQKLAVEADIQPIRTANAELYKVDQEIDRLNSKKINIDISESMKNLGNSVSRMGDGILKAFNPLTSKLNQMIGFGLINNLIGKGLNMVTGSVDGAISRVDTLNNFPKTMSNMNIAVEESEKAIQDLSEGLTGLPTRVDAAANSVQQFTNKNKDIGKSTNMFLSLNNAMLAGGADMQKQQSALDQLTKAYSTSNMDLNVWQAMQQAMPAQLSQVSQAFQKTDDELYKALQSGSISMDEFMDKIIELNTTGVDGMQSFEQQAKNSVGGLKTSMANMNSAVTRGVAKIITTVDEIGKSKGLNGISGIFGKIGSFFENGLKSIAESIEKNQDAIFGFFESVVSFLVSIDYASFFEGLVEGLTEMGSMAKGIFNFIKPLFSLLGNGDVTKGLGKLIPKMLMLGIALKGIGLATKGLGSVFGILGKFKNFKLPSFGFGKSGAGGSSLPLQNIGVEQFKDLGLKLAMIAGLSANVYLAAKAVQEVTKIETMEGIYEKLAVIALAVSGMGLISIAVDKVSKMAGTSMITGLIAITAISAEIYVMSLSLEKLASIEMSFIDIQKKMGSIALVIGEMTLVTVAVGAFMATGYGALALGAGFVAITALALEIMVLAETIKQLDEKVPNDFGNVKSKIETIISVLDSIVDSNLSSFGTLFDSIVAGFTTGSIIKTLDNLIVISDKLKELNTKGSFIDSEKTNRIISSIQSVLNELSLEGGFWSSVGQAFKNKADSAVYNNAIYAIENITTLAERIREIEKVSINSDKVEKNIEAIQKILPLIDANNFAENGFKLLKADFIDSIDTTIYYIIKLFDRIKQLESINIDVTTTQTNIASIKGIARMLTLDKWSEFNEGLVNLQLLKNIDSAIEQLSGVGQQLKSLIKSVPENGEAQNALTVLRGALRMLKAENWDEFKEGYVTSSLFENVVKTLKSLEEISTSMANIANNSVETGVVQDIIVNIKGALRMMKLSAWEEFSEGFVDKNLIEPSLGSLKVIQELSEKLFNLSSIPMETGAAQDVIINLKGALRMLKAESWIEYQSGFIDKNFLEPLNPALDVIEEIGKKLKTLAEMGLDSGAANDNLAAIRGVLRMLVIDKWTEYSSGFVDKNLIEPVTLSLGVLKEVGEKLQIIGNLNVDGNSKKINDEIATIKGCLRMLRAESWIDFQNGFIEYKTLEKAVEALSVLKTITDKFSQLQELDAKAVNDNIARVKGLLRSLKAENWAEYADSMVSKEDLQKYADLIEPLKNAISKMSEIKSDEINIAGIQKNITGFRGIISRLTLDNFPDTENLISNELVNKATSTVDSLVAFGNKLPTLGEIEFSEEAVISRLSSMKRIIDTMNEFSFKEGMENAQNLIQVFIDMANKMNEMSTTTFQPIGKSWGEKVIQGFKESDVPKQILSIVNNLISDLNKKTNTFKKIGSDWGNALKSSFNSAIQGLGNGIDNQINSMSNKANAFSSLGNTYGKFLNDGFNNALVMLDNSVSDRISNLQRSISNVQTLSNSSSSTNSRRPNPVVLASGGKVSSPTGFARIVDSYEQPILGNGEGIIPKKIMDKIGMPFFEQLRRGQVSPTFANLGKSISNTTSSVVNNVYNNTTTTNQQMTMYTTAAPDAINIMNRRLR